MFASWKGLEEVVELLLDAGANPNLVSARIAKNTQAPLPETTALAQALENKHFSITRLLLARGAIADPVSIAIAGGLDDLSVLKAMHAAGAKILLANGANRKFQPGSGQVTNQTALEFLESKRALAIELIERNRYGVKQQTADRAWLNHMDENIELIQR
jgi:ankyrin repeat protein